LGIQPKEGNADLVTIFVDASNGVETRREQFDTPVNTVKWQAEYYIAQKLAKMNAVDQTESDLKDIVGSVIGPSLAKWLPPVE
jgi:F420-dependent methylenetetrahydromethanopterin dehydrogenase